MKIQICKFLIIISCLQFPITQANICNHLLKTIRHEISADEIKLNRAVAQTLFALSEEQQFLPTITAYPELLPYILFKHMHPGVSSNLETTTAEYFLREAAGLNPSQLTTLDIELTKSLKPEVKVALLGLLENSSTKQFKDRERHDAYIRYLKILLDDPKAKFKDKSKLRVAWDRAKLNITKLKDNSRIFLKKLIALPENLLKIRRIVKSEMTPAILDNYFYAMMGNRLYEKGEFSMRPWKSLNLKKVDSTQVQGVSQDDFVKVMNTAMEIEDPIEGYSVTTGKGLQFLLPTLGRFTGRSELQESVFRYSIKHGLPVDGKVPKKWICGAVWCREENRHANIFDALIQKIRNIDEVDRTNANMVDEVEGLNNEEASLHLLSRISTEWDAASVYFWMTQHSNGELREAVRNVMRDEIKHFTIFSNGDFYLYGYTPKRRLYQMVKKAVSQLLYHSKAREGASANSGFPGVFSSIEIILAHIFVESAMQKYLATVPYRTRKWMFESPKAPKVTPPPGLFNQGQESVRLSFMAFDHETGGQKESFIDVSKEMFGKLNKRLQKEWEIRQSLSRYPKAQRELILKMIQFEGKKQEQIEAFIKIKLKGFKGAEIANSKSSQEMEKSILTVEAVQGIYQDEIPLLKKVLLERLRHYQITDSNSELAAKNIRNRVRTHPF